MPHQNNGFIDRVIQLAISQRVGYTTEGQLIHLDEDDLTIKTFHAEGSLGEGGDYDVRTRPEEAKIDRLYLQSLIPAGTRAYEITDGVRDALSDFYGHRWIYGLNGENKLVEAAIMGLKRIEIVWK